MHRTTRRSFVVSATSAIGALSLPESLLARSEALMVADAELGLLIGKERAAIRRAMAQERIRGAAICLIRDGKPAWMEGFGVTDEASAHPVGLDTIFSI